MKKQLRVFFGFSWLALLLISFFHLPSAFAQVVKSNCIQTHVGAPPVIVIPPECQGAGGAPGGSGRIPLIKQWDPRWAEDSYGCGETVKSSGCGPTSLAMVMSYHLGKEILPPETIKISMEKGWRVCGAGTSWDAMIKMPTLYGLKSKQIGWEEAKRYLDQKIPIIQSHSSGFFTGGGHFIVLTEKSANGYLVNDPDGFHRTEATEAQITASLKASWVISK